MTVSAIIKHRLSTLVTAAESDGFQAIADKLSTHNIGAVVVLADAGKLAGIISERDLVRAVTQHKAAVFGVTAKDMMTRKVYVCTPHQTEIEVMKYMLEKHIRHMPVVDGGTVVGMVSLADAVRYRLVKIKLLFEGVGLDHEQVRDLGIFTQHLRHKTEPKAG